MKALNGVLQIDKSLRRVLPSENEHISSDVARIVVYALYGEYACAQLSGTTVVSVIH